MFVNYLITAINKNWDGCIITRSVAFIVTAVLCGESISTLTPFSVDRLLALLLELRYRQVVTLRRVRLFVISSWITNFAVFSFIFGTSFSSL